MRIARRTIMSWAALACLSMLWGCGQPEPGDELASDPSAARPNILLIVADDLGYTDLGSFGGEIATPNLDRLARAGLRLTNFHAAASCAATRAMLMTGTDHHLAGVGSQSRLATELQLQHRAYRNRLLPEVPTIAERLKDLGYQTFASTKWHIGREPGELPGARGFDRSFVLLQGGAGHFDRTPIFEGRSVDWLEDDQPATLPESFYSTDHMTDRMIGYLRSAGDAPFFGFLGFTAPHWPLQAPPDSIRLYAEQYSGGWDRLRAERMAGAIAEGVVADDAEAVDHEPGMQAWSELSADAQAGWARRMSVYAAMVHRLDENVGRLLAALAESGRLDDTVIFFMSDNGAEGHDLEERANRSGWLDANFDNSVASIGSAASYTSLGPGWARATAAPYRDSKSKASEGGVRVPAFVRVPGGASGVSDAFMRAMDLAPTFLQLAGSSADGSMMGRSLLAQFQGGPDPYGDDETVAYELYGRLAARRGSWKALRQEAPHGSGEWQLYNLAVDPGEQEDLALEHPRLLESLVSDWEDYARRVGVVLPEHPINY